MENLQKIGMGGGCHWCTEAVFQAIKGVEKVQQGYIASLPPEDELSEGVIVHFDPEVVNLQKLIKAHLLTHRATSSHSFRKKYRSAIYYFDPEKAHEAKMVLEELQKEFKEPLITRVLAFKTFKASRISIQNYYRKQPEAPFCTRYIEPKLEILKTEFG
jgi:peptide-methionine (S)-S-oxide reductase